MREEGPAGMQTVRKTETVYVIDDDAAMRRSIERLIQSVGLRVKTFESAYAFLDEFDPEGIGCLVLDLRMPEMNGVQLQDVLNRRGVLLPVIMVSAFGNVPTVVRAMKNGATDFIEKPFEPEQLLERVYEALQRAKQMHQRRHTQTRTAQLIARLTTREREVLDLLAGGRTAKQIALDLGLSPKTVHTHRAQVFKKLEAESVVELARIATAADALENSEDRLSTVEG